MKTQSKLTSLSLVTLITLGSSACGVKLEGGESPSRLESQKNCDAGFVKIGNVCAGTEHTEGNYQRLSSFGAAGYWYHTPTRRLLIQPLQRGSVSYTSAKDLCENAHTHYPIDLPVSFKVPEEKELTKLLTEEGLAAIYPSTSGRFWTSTTDGEGWHSIVKFPEGTHFGEGHPDGYRAEVICVAPVPAN